MRFSITSLHLEIILSLILFFPPGNANQTSFPDPVLASRHMQKKTFPYSGDTNGISQSWVPTFNPFDDLRRVNQSFPSPAERDRFFAFTMHNIQESRVVEWYKEWTIARSNSTEWHDMGEWPLFFKEIVGEPNFLCTLVNQDCIDASSMTEIELRYMQYPDYARRAYFVKHMYTMYHHRAKNTLESYKAAQIYLTPNVGEIVHATQQEQDPSKAALCELAHKLIELGVNLAMSVAGAMSDGIVHTVSKDVKDLGKTLEKVFGLAFQGVQLSMLAATDPDMVPLNVAQGTLGKFGDKVQEFIDKHPEADIYMPKLNVFNLVTVDRFGGVNRALLGYLRSPKTSSGGPNRAPGGWDSISVQGGQGTDALCDNFEGSTGINVPRNIEELQLGLANKFREMRDIIAETYDQYYNGTLTKPGGISWTAAAFNTTTWEGADSLIKDVGMYTENQHFMELQMAMQVASIASAHDQSHMVCTHLKNATHICAEASQVDKPCKSMQKDCKRTVFCPEPMTDPDLICRAQKWYASKNGGHLTTLPSAEKWEGLLQNNFHLTRQKILLSAWQYYKAYGNEFNSLAARWGSKSNNIMDMAGGFHLPVCFKEGMDIFDEDFPAACGEDWRNNQTSQFMEAIHMGPSSGSFWEDNGDIANSFVTGVLPMALQKKTTSPVARYLSYCENHIRFPNKIKEAGVKEHPLQKYRVHRGQDASCDIVKAATITMDEEEANRWFCRVGANEHKVFETEYDHIAFPSGAFGHIKVPSGSFLYSHKKNCAHWKLDRKGDIPSTLPDGLFDPSGDQTEVEKKMAQSGGESD